MRRWSCVIGFIAAFVCSLFYLLKKFRFIIFKGIIIGLAILLTVLTYARNNAWKDNITLWKDAVSKYPQNARAYINLSGAYAGKGQFNDAITVLQKAITIDPRNKFAHFDLARCYQQSGKPDKAIKECMIALQIDPKNIESYILLASLYMREGDTRKALFYHQRFQEQSVPDTRRSP